MFQVVTLKGGIVCSQKSAVSIQVEQILPEFPENIPNVERCCQNLLSHRLIEVIQTAVVGLVTICKWRDHNTQILAGYLWVLGLTLKLYCTTHIPTMNLLQNLLIADFVFHTYEEILTDRQTMWYWCTLISYLKVFCPFWSFSCFHSCLHPLTAHHLCTHSYVSLWLQCH